MTGCSRENAKKIAVGLGLVPSVYTERNETMEENQDDLTKRTRIARIEAAALAVLPRLMERAWDERSWEAMPTHTHQRELLSDVRDQVQILKEAEERIIAASIETGRAFADAMEQEERES